LSSGFNKKNESIIKSHILLKLINAKSKTEQVEHTDARRICWMNPIIQPLRKMLHGNEKN